MHNAKLFLTVGAINGALAVILGAFGAHVLKSHLSTDMYAVFRVAERYHFYHALGMLAVGLTALQLPGSRALAWSGWLMITGIVLFSGSLYALSLTDLRWLGAITPFGGTAFIAAWILFAVGVSRDL